MNELIIGSRGSRLALWQANHVSSLLRALNPDLAVRIEIIKTSGDKMTEVGLATIGGKGVFVKEIEEALLRNQIHLAVHSLKDVPTELPEGLELSTIPEREDARDALVLRENGSHLSALSPGAVVGTGSLRRSLQLGNLRSDITIRPIRGNVDTRLKKLDAGLDGVVLAMAGLNRLGFSERVGHVFAVQEMTPAVGQGALAIETRAEDRATHALLEPLEHDATRLCVIAERYFLSRMGGGCQVPMGAHASIDGGKASLVAFVAGPASSRLVRYSLEGRPDELSKMVDQTVAYLLERGATEMLQEVSPDHE